MPRSALMGHMVYPIFNHTVFLVAAPFYNPTNSTQGFQFLHILINACHLLFFIVAILVSSRWYLYL